MQTPRLVLITVGVEMDDADATGSLFSVWESLDALRAAIGTSWDSLVVPADLAELCWAIEVRHVGDAGLWPGPGYGALLGDTHIPSR